MKFGSMSLAETKPILARIGIVFAIITTAFLGWWIFEKRSQLQESKWQRLLESEDQISSELLSIDAVSDAVTKNSFDNLPVQDAETLKPELTRFQQSIVDGYTHRIITVIKSKDSSQSQPESIVLMRLHSNQPRIKAAINILDNQKHFQLLLQEFEGLRPHINGNLDTVIFRLEQITEPIFEDTSYRKSLSQLEKLWQHRSTLIYDFDAALSHRFGSEPRPGKDVQPSQATRQEIETKIQELQQELQSIGLGETDERVPLIKRIQSLRAELASKSATLSSSAQLLQDYPSIVIGVYGNERQLFKIATNQYERKLQIEWLKKWQSFERTDFIEFAKEDLRQNPPTEIEIRRRLRP